MNSLQDIYNKLGLAKDNGLYITSENTWKSALSLSNRIVRLLENTICPDSFFCIDNKPIILFFNNPTNKEQLHRQIWNFNESAIVVMIEESCVNVYNGFKYEPLLKSLSKFDDKNILTDLNYFEILQVRHGKSIMKRLYIRIGLIIAYSTTFERLKNS